MTLPQKGSNLLMVCHRRDSFFLCSRCHMYVCLVCVWGRFDGVKTPALYGLVMGYGLSSGASFDCEGFSQRHCCRAMCWPESTGRGQAGSPRAGTAKPKPDGVKYVVSYERTVSGAPL